MAGSPETHRQVFCPAKLIWREIRETPCRLAIRFAMIFGGLGLIVRVLLLIISGNTPIGPLSGVGDQVRYRTLADNLYEGRGFTYAAQPTALRPPLYPVFLAAMRFLFGSHHFLAARCFQFLAAIAMAYLCLLLARRLFGIESGILAGSFALAMPSLALVMTELQAEALTACATLLFLCLLVDAFDGSTRAAPWLGLVSGLAALLRFNSVLLLAFAVAVSLRNRRILRSALFVCLAASLVLAPWIIRNARSFHGRILFSSQGGVNLLQGVLSPQGRAQADDPELPRAAVGWLHTDIETNNASRVRYPSEDVLDRQARAAAFQAWKQLDARAAVRLFAVKVSAFVFSTDQLLETASFTRKQRLVRAAGVVCYWCVLVLAVMGWARLVKLERSLALWLGSYVLLVILVHLPFVMNTRLRIPFLDALLAVLAGGGLSLLLEKYQRPRSGALVYEGAQQ